MTPTKCFYCASENESITCVHHMFGIKHCSLHSADGTRDCNAYKHRNHMVDMQDISVLPHLIARAPYTVRRTSGLLDEGWLLDMGTSWDIKYICKTVEGEWRVPLVKGDIIKNVSIQELLSSTELEQSLAILEAGVYAADAAAAAECIKIIPWGDPSFITQAHCDGVVCRVANTGLEIRPSASDPVPAYLSPDI